MQMRKWKEKYRTTKDRNVCLRDNSSVFQYVLGTAYLKIKPSENTKELSQSWNPMNTENIGYFLP